MKAETIRATLRSTGEVIRRIIGVPDYDIYMRHMQECHAGKTPMSREDFEKSRLEDKYSRPGQRCC